MPQYDKDYLKEFLKKTSVSLALWRATECRALSEFSYEQPILDLGCGDGLFASILFEEKIAEGIDIGQKEVNMARRIGAYVNVKKAEAASLPYPDNTFQTVLSNCVLEHIPEVEKVIHEISRVLKDGGKLFFTVPSEFFGEQLLSYNIFKRMRIYGLAIKCIEIANRVFKHYHCYSKDRWSEMLSKESLNVIYTRYLLPAPSEHIFELFLPFSIIALVNKKIFGRWVILPRGIITSIFGRILRKFYLLDGTTGGALLIVAEKRNRN